MNSQRTSIHICKPHKPKYKPKLAREYAFPGPNKTKKSSLSLKNKTLQTHNPTDKNEMTEHTENIKGMSLDKKEGQLVTGGCCQWRDSASFDSEVVNKTFVLRRNFCDKSPPNSNRQPLQASVKDETVKQKTTKIK